MRNILFFILIVPYFNCWSLTEIIENTENGTTYIDPSNHMARVNYKTDVRQATEPPEHSCNKLIVIKRKDEKGTISSERFLSKTESCDSLSQKYNNLVDYQEYPAMTLTLKDPKTCANSSCEKRSTPLNKTMDIKLGSQAFKEALKKCSPQDELLVIKDMVSSHGAISSLKGSAQCPLPRKRILSPLNWMNKEDPQTQIYTSEKPGFFIGNHTHYYFDFNKNQWCRHFKPDEYFEPEDIYNKKLMAFKNKKNIEPSCQEKINLSKREPVCTGLNNATIPIAFEYSDKSNKTIGAIKLSLENGKKPIAMIGSAANSDYIKGQPTELLVDKPLIKVSFNQDTDSKNSRSTIFESQNSSQGPALQRLTVSPSYVLGQKINVPGTCSSAACLNVPTEVSGDQKQSTLFCKNNKNPFDLNSDLETCYSCNGVTAGACGTESTLITKTGEKSSSDDTRQYLTFANAYSQMQSCRGSTAEENSPVDTAQ